MREKDDEARSATRRANALQSELAELERRCEGLEAQNARQRADIRALLGQGSKMDALRDMVSGKQVRVYITRWSLI